MHEVTQDDVWLERYRRAAAERPAMSDKTRLQICAEGYGRDREAIERIDDLQQWIYVGSQASLAHLVAMETDEGIRAQYGTGLAVNARDSLKALEAHQEFDNHDTKVFRNADWRAVYATWFPQPTQAEAERLSRIADKAKRGERKFYEPRLMQNPLAAAVIVTLAGDQGGRECVAPSRGRRELKFLECVASAIISMSRQGTPRSNPRRIVWDRPSGCSSPRAGKWYG